MRRAERLFQTIQILRRSTKPVTGPALAAELEVSTRTVYRDVADLIGQRVPITGEAGVGYVLSDDYDMPPLMLTPAEVEAIVLGAQWVAARDDAVLSLAARDVLAKIMTVVPAELRPFVVEPATGVPPRLTHSESRTDAAVLREAIRSRTKLRLTYRAGDDAETERTVWPLILGYSDANRILVAWCELRQGFRLFRTDRMMSVAVLAAVVPEPRRVLLQRFEEWRAEVLRLLPQD